MVSIVCSPVSGQVLDVDRMISKTALGHQQDLHPVIRTLLGNTLIMESRLPVLILIVVCGRF